MTVGEKLVKLRRENNLTQEQFAEILKVSRQSVSKWELDATYPDTEKLITISKVFNCSLDYLLKDEIEQANVNLAAANEAASYDRMRAWLLTFLSFLPFGGYITAIFSINFQVKYMRNQLQTILSVVGFLFSVTLTVFIIVGIIN